MFNFRKNRVSSSRARQWGSAMLEMLGSVGLGAAVVAGVNDQTNRYLDNTRAAAAGEYQRLAAEAAVRFLNDPTTPLSESATAIPWTSVTQTVPEASSITGTNVYDEPFCLIAKTIDDRGVKRRAGILIAKKSPGMPTASDSYRRYVMINNSNVSTGMINGNKAGRSGVWETNLSEWDVTNQCDGNQNGAVVTNLDLMKTASISIDESKFLHRQAQSDPTLNTMETDLNMGGKAINNVDSITAAKTIRADQGFKVGTTTVIDRDLNISAKNVTSSGNITATGSITASGNITAGDYVKSTSGLRVGTITVIDSEQRATFMGGSDATGWTRFPHPDGKNYIRGTTIIADTGGNVGIGTATPSSKLHVNGTAEFEGAVTMKSGLNITSKTLDFGSRNGQLITAWGNDHGIGVQGATTYFRSSNDFQFYKGGVHSDARGNAGGGTALMTLLGTGKVGIGNTNPEYKLDVAGVVNADSGFYSAGEKVIDHLKNAFFKMITAANMILESGEDNYIEMKATAGNNRIVGLDKIQGRSGKTITFESDAISVNGGVKASYVSTTGNVSVGGGITVDGSATVGGNVTVTGGITAGDSQKISGGFIEARYTAMVGSTCSDPGRIAVSTDNVPVFCNSGKQWQLYGGFEIIRRGTTSRPPGDDSVA
ncbi:MAG: hypothetical protein RIR70_1083, partial [Pseudomonadota bacterium]